MPLRVTHIVKQTLTVKITGTLRFKRDNSDGYANGNG